MRNIDNPLKKTINHENKTEMTTLLNLKFQLYNNEIYNRGSIYKFIRLDKKKGGKTQGFATY